MSIWGMREIAKMKRTKVFKAFKCRFNDKQKCILITKHVLWLTSQIHFTSTFISKFVHIVQKKLLSKDHLNVFAYNLNTNCREYKSNYNICLVNIGIHPRFPSDELPLSCILNHHHIFQQFNKSATFIYYSFKETFYLIKGHKSIFSYEYYDIPVHQYSFTIKSVSCFIFNASLYIFHIVR